jgi:hypothetical protein
MGVESAAVGRVIQRKTTYFTMRMDPRIKDAAEMAAADDRRSLAALIEILLENYCLEHGYLKPERGKQRRP